MSERTEHKKLERQRSNTLSCIRGERLTFEEMLQRPRRADDPLPDERFLTGVRERLTEIEQRATGEANIEELERLSDDAEEQGQLRAYCCPREEIEVEGALAIELMEEWGVPKAIVTNLHRLVDQALKNADKDVDGARGALRAAFEESDSWRDYTSEYEYEMQRLTRWLFWPTVALVLGAFIALHFPVTLPLGILLAGTAGSSASVMSKMPGLDVRLSNELESYSRRILSRVGVGIIASIVGCGLLGWGFISISIQGQTFADILKACSISPRGACTTEEKLILLAIPMLFGFSERALTSFESTVFGKSGPKRSTRR